MDPLTAFFTFATKLAELCIVIAEGQPPEVKKQVWEWWIEDVKAWRKVFKIEPPKP